MGKVSKQEVLDGILLGLQAAPDVAEESLERLTNEINGKLSGNTEGKTSYCYIVKIDLGVDTGSNKKIAVDVKDDFKQPKMVNSCHAGEVHLGQMLDGVDNDFGKNSAQGQGRDMNTGESPEEQIDNLNQEPDEE